MTAGAICAVTAALATAKASACASTAKPASTPSAPAGPARVRTGAGSTFDAPFFDLAFARYHQQQPGVAVRYSAVGSSAGIAAFTARRWDEQQQKMTGPWEYKVSKTKLAEALWPILRAKIDRRRADADAPVPEIVEVVQDAYHLAQRWRYQSFLLSEDPAARAHSNNCSAAAPR